MIIYLFLFQIKKLIFTHTTRLNNNIYLTKQMEFKNCNNCTFYDGVVVKHSKHCAKYGQLNKDQPKYEDIQLLKKTIDEENRSKKYRTLFCTLFLIIYMIFLYFSYL